MILGWVGLAILKLLHFFIFILQFPWWVYGTSSWFVLDLLLHIGRLTYSGGGHNWAEEEAASLLPPLNWAFASLLLLLPQWANTKQLQKNQPINSLVEKSYMMIGFTWTHSSGKLSRMSDMRVFLSSQFTNMKKMSKPVDCVTFAVP